MSNEQLLAQWLYRIYERYYGTDWLAENGGADLWAIAYPEGRPNETEAATLLNEFAPDSRVTVGKVS